MNPGGSDDISFATVDSADGSIRITYHLQGESAPARHSILSARWRLVIPRRQAAVSGQVASFWLPGLSRPWPLSGCRRASRQ